MSEQGRFSSYRYGEGRTGIGQLVSFTCPQEEVVRIQQFLADNVRTIRIPTTGQVNVPHGGFGQYTRYDIVQHKYAGGGSGFIEVLEVKDPPDGYWGIVINEFSSRRSVFTEWETIEDACAAFDKFWCSYNTAKEFPGLKGFKRSVSCGELTPWFYAIGDEKLVGDYAFPEGLQDDPVYRFGRQFVVFDDENIPSVKTCMGTRYVTRKSEFPPYATLQFRRVYWSDGGVWEEGGRRGDPPRPIEEGELWITEAVRQFKQLLAGRTTEVLVKFANGDRFAGKLTRKNHRSPCAEGDYFLIVHVKGAEKPMTGWVSDFKPTPDCPDIIQYVTQSLAKKGKEVERIEIKKTKIKKGGRKWSGVFFAPPS